jgi:hypothetical protein
MFACFTTRLPRFALLLVTGLCCCTAAWSEDSKRLLSAGLEAARWQEYGNSDVRLLSESGLRLTLAAAWEDLFPDNPFARINASSRIYTGGLSYDGQTQSLDPNASGIYISSTSRYTGFNAEVETLFDLESLSTAALFGIGVDLWRRAIDNAHDAKGNGVSGFTEDYQVLYAKLGLQKEIRSAFGRSRMRIGIKYPLRINERASGISPELHPGRRVSLFMAYRADLATYRPSIIEIYYEGLRLSASPAVVDEFGNAWMQPPSHQDIIGITFGIPF